MVHCAPHSLVLRDARRFHRPVPSLSRDWAALRSGGALAGSRAWWGGYLRARTADKVWARAPFIEAVASFTEAMFTEAMTEE
jgi:hypothetical protein